MTVVCSRCVAGGGEREGWFVEWLWLIWKALLSHMTSSEEVGISATPAPHRCYSCTLPVTRHLGHQHTQPQPHGWLRAAGDEDGPAGPGLQLQCGLPGPEPGSWRLHVLQTSPRAIPLLPLLPLLQHDPLRGEEQQTRESSDDPGKPESQHCHW